MRGAFILAAAFILGAATLYFGVLEEAWVSGVDPSAFGRKVLGGTSAWHPSPEALKRGVPSPLETALQHGVEAALPGGSFSPTETGLQHGHGVPSSTPPEAVSPALLHLFNSPQAEVMPDEGTMLGLGEGKVFQANDGDASSPPPPPPPPPPNPWEERRTKKVLTIIGCILTILVYCNPIIVFWSTGNNMIMTAAFCTMIDFIGSVMGTGAWLLFAVVQLHGEDGKTVGVEAVLSNAVGLALLTMYITIKIAAPRNLNAMVCFGSLTAFATIIGLSVSLAVLGPIQKDSMAAHDMALAATGLQVFSQFIPYISVYGLFRPSANPPPMNIRNMRPLLIYSRASNFIISLFWAMYAVLTYQHTMFEVANVSSTILGFGSLCLHLVYALGPDAV
ncbi:hypothetical protein D1007_39516 [Hordeum vulgare]|nr:hypothetical protein D1007_39516 [Hordeum vulgare]